MKRKLLPAPGPRSSSFTSEPNKRRALSVGTRPTGANRETVASNEPDPGDFDGSETSTLDQRRDSQAGFEPSATDAIEGHESNQRSGGVYSLGNVHSGSRPGISSSLSNGANDPAQVQSKKSIGAPIVWRRNMAISVFETLLTKLLSSVELFSAGDFRDLFEASSSRRIAWDQVDEMMRHILTCLDSGAFGRNNKHHDQYQTKDYEYVIPSRLIKGFNLVSMFTNALRHPTASTFEPLQSLLNQEISGPEPKEINTPDQFLKNLTSSLQACAKNLVRHLQTASEENGLGELGLELPSQPRPSAVSLSTNALARLEKEVIAEDIEDQTQSRQTLEREDVLHSQSNALSMVAEDGRRQATSGAISTESGMTAQDEDGRYDNGQSSGVESDDNQEDQDAVTREFALAAHAALSKRQPGQTDLSPLVFTSTPADSTASSNLSQTRGQRMDLPTSSPAELPQVQTVPAALGSSASIKEQYERAREEHEREKANERRRATLQQSQRRPWNSAEENALMAGLDKVKGPHWKEILAMFGRGGTVSEVLRDRTQVQLKDKARNIKLFFLKSGYDVPSYLKGVTGDLMTRAPAKARKNEAKQRLVESQTEDRATADALNFLSGGPSAIPGE